MDFYPKMLGKERSFASFYSALDDIRSETFYAIHDQIL